MTQPEALPSTPTTADLFSEAPTFLAGFRLMRLEVLNWGTFNQRVWAMDLGGRNALLTGDIGSGKSTLVDAVTTLLVPTGRIAYNKAAGADAKERSLRSYVMGHFKSERNDATGNAKPVPLRGAASYSVILGVFHNAALQQSTTLAQVFWLKDVAGGAPERFYAVADQQLSIAADFSEFGSAMPALKTRLRKTGAQVYDSFKEYGARFRRSFGIDSEQALELFHQTVSMKSVGNLTHFVRQHMLEPFDVQVRIDALLTHFDNLSRAHAAVLKAKRQLELLTPLVADCDKHAELQAASELLRACRDALRPHFAKLKLSLIDERLQTLAEDLEKDNAKVSQLEGVKSTQLLLCSELRTAVAHNGGNRISQIQADIERKEGEGRRRQANAQRYDTLRQQAGLLQVASLTDLVRQQQTCSQKRALETARREEVVKNEIEKSTELQAGRGEHDALSREITSLKSRRSNIDTRQIDIRKALCLATGFTEDSMPFVGELIEVRPDERDWEGAIERALHGFSLSLLVPEAQYAKVAEWVDQTPLKARLVYYKAVLEKQTLPEQHPDSIVRKIAVKPDAPLYRWLDHEVQRRFNPMACCSTQAQFRRERVAITAAGQVKGGQRHEKDDRFHISDRSRYMLGWSNTAKLADLEGKRRVLEDRLGRVGTQIAALQKERTTIDALLIVLHQLELFSDFTELDWPSLAQEVAKLQGELGEIKAASSVLAVLATQLEQAQTALGVTEKSLAEQRVRHGKTEQRQSDAHTLRDATAKVLQDAEGGPAAPAVTARIDQLHAELAGAAALSVESCESRQDQLRTALQKQLDADSQRASRLQTQIIEAMSRFKAAHTLESQDMDISVQAAGEYRALLEQLQRDGLPQFEAAFKTLLNENTIRELSSFSAQLRRERDTIKDRIARINQSLAQIDYNPGRFIVLQAQTTTDAEVRDFQTELRACLDGAFSGLDGEGGDASGPYSEAKFLQVKAIIERLAGRAGQTEQDRRWTAKVTDVRHWFVFAASECWREDGREHEHYADSGGKSGGQKEKLAYTILAASLAYQFGLESAADSTHPTASQRARSFRFVVIDEAFGRGSDESAHYGLALFEKLQLQLLIVTPLQKIHIIEPFVASVGFVYNAEGRDSQLRNLSMADYHAEKDRLAALASAVARVKLHALDATAADHAVD